MKIDDEKYKNIYDEKVKFPESVDKLILIIGCYGDAFTQEYSEILYSILNLECFADLYSIANIHQNMIPFVATDKLDFEALSQDYDIFSEKAKNFACEILEVNTDFETHCMLYTSDTDTEPEDAMDVKGLVMEEMV